MWISVEDRLPEPGALVDVFQYGTVRLTDCYLYHVDSRNEAGQFVRRCPQWNRDDGRYAEGVSITHWMERPAPPGAAQGTAQCILDAMIANIRDSINELAVASDP